MDYEKLGFKCGIEIHQQLETHKLFCECPSIVHDKDPDVYFIRRLRAAAGETGEIDAAAAHEQAEGKYYLYEGCSTSSCLVEMDEEPPHPVNKDALEIAVQIAMMLNAKLVDEVQVMRKTVVDGSNVSGFQRTALIAQDGYVETSKGKVKVDSVCLEEEAAKRVEESNEFVKFRLDRLGVPLVEIATDASIKDPEHAKEVAEKIGLVLRSTGKVKRGIGTIRQDVNISIKKGNRIEIKGFQELKSMPRVIDYEVKRQKELVEAGKEVTKEVRKAEADGKTSFLRPMPGAARMYPETDVVPEKIFYKDYDIPELIEEKAQRYEKELKLGNDLALKLAKSNKAVWFDKFVKVFKNVKPAFIAETLVSSSKEIKRKFSVDVVNLTDKEYEEIFRYLDSGKISKESVMNVLIDYAKGEFRIEKYALMGEDELEAEVKKILDENKGAPANALIGKVMGQLRGKADGKKIVEIVKKLTE